MYRANEIELIVENILYEYDSNIYTDTILLAEIFKRNHKNILEAIRNLKMPARFYETHVIESSYIDKKGESRTMYKLSFEGFILVAGSFTGSKVRPLKTNIILKFIELKENLYKNKDKKESLSFETSNHLTLNY